MIKGTKATYKIFLCLLQEESTRKEKSDATLTSSDSPSGLGADTLHYRNGDEPEPVDLTHLNVEV